MNAKSQPPTSLSAHRAMTPELRAQHHRRILDALSSLQQATFERIAEHARMDKVQVGRRLCELEAEQLVVKTGTTKATRSGRQAQVYKLHPDEWFRRYLDGEYEPKPEKSTFKQLAIF